MAGIDKTLGSFHSLHLSQHVIFQKNLIQDTSKHKMNTTKQAKPKPCKIGHILNPYIEKISF